ATGILEQQLRSDVATNEFQRAHGPRTIQLIPQPVLMGETIQAGWGRLLRSRQQGQHDATITAGVQVRSSAQEPFAVVPQEQKTPVSHECLIVGYDAVVGRWPQMSCFRHESGGPLMVEATSTVIIIDDDPAIRHSLGSLLRSVGFQVRLLSSVGEFLTSERPCR